MQALITFDGLESTQAFSDYINEKLDKHAQLLNDATSISVVFRQHRSARGVNHDFKVSITVHLPKKVLRVEESSDEMRKAIDIADQALFRRLRRYKSKFHRIPSQRPGKEI